MSADTVAQAAEVTAVFISPSKEILYQHVTEC